MNTDSSHIKKIFVISNTHWDREFRFSFEKTRHHLLKMMDTTLDILQNDKDFHSFTMDGHSIMIDDYLEIRPERREQVEKFVKEGRLVIGPYYTLAEEFSVSQEAMVRNLIYGKRTVEKYGGKTGTVAYTPSSWGQTGQLPQLLQSFGLDKMMFYRGISHHEADAEWIWKAPDGTQVLASRFAIYARYNWYYQVHRPTYRNRVFEKDYIWGEFDEAPFMISDKSAYENKSYEITDPIAVFDDSRLAESIEKMVEAEGRHFMSDVFLAMNGHDISVAYPLESAVIKRANELLKDKYDIRHSNLEEYWNEALKTLKLEELSVLTGERRAYLKQGMWTFLFPSTISSRTYLKQKDFDANNRLVYSAEPFSAIATSLGKEKDDVYLDRAWRYLLSNHTHDANGGCAPDVVCSDMEYRYRKVCDISDIVTEGSMSYITRNLSPQNYLQDDLLLVVFNSLPYKRDVVEYIEIEVPRILKGKSIRLVSADNDVIEIQKVDFNPSSVFVDSIWEVPTILDVNTVKGYARFNSIPATGYRVYKIEAVKEEPMHNRTMITGVNSMENEFIEVKVNVNGTADITNKKTGKIYKGINYLTDEGECGNAWKHVSPKYDSKFNSLGVCASVAISLSGENCSEITASYDFAIPKDYSDGTRRSDEMAVIPVKVTYRLEKYLNYVKVTVDLENNAKDHLLRMNWPTGISTDNTISDTHFDIIKRAIAVPDSTGWVEKAGGAHPLQTFVSMSDDRDFFAIIPKGLYEYEAFEDKQATLALTLLRACRIKLAVSEEKQTELSDIGISCPGRQVYEYAICVGESDGEQNSSLINTASEYIVPVRIAACGLGT